MKKQSLETSQCREQVFEISSMSAGAPEIVKPSFNGECISNIVPAVLHGDTGNLPVHIDQQSAKVLLVLDGLGWEQLISRTDLAPQMSAMSGSSITSVAPSTTAAALTSITTGMAPGEHGVVGYRFKIAGHLLNALSWRDEQFKDLRKIIPPETVQTHEPFMGYRCAYVSKEEFRGSGFTAASLRGSQLIGYRTIGTLISHVVAQVAAGEKFTYCYYDGIDKVSHEYGFGAEFDSELAFVDLLVGALADSLPSGTQLLLTSDHGQVDCGDNLVELSHEILSMVDCMSGEGRFRWLHTQEGKVPELLSLATQEYESIAWVYTLEQLLDEHIFGPVVSIEARSRLGDVALVPFEPTAFLDPFDRGSFELKGRHGSLTSAEMLVPLLSVSC